VEVGQGHDVQGVVGRPRTVGANLQHGVADAQVRVGKFLGEAEARPVVLLLPAFQEVSVDACGMDPVPLRRQHVGHDDTGARQGFAESGILSGVRAPAPEEDVQRDGPGSSLLQALDQVQVDAPADGPLEARLQGAVVEDHQHHLFREAGQGGGARVHVAPAGPVGLEVPVHPGSLDQVLHEADPGSLLQEGEQAAGSHTHGQTQQNRDDPLVPAVVAGQMRHLRQLHGGRTRTLRPPADLEPARPPFAGKRQERVLRTAVCRIGRGFKASRDTTRDPGR